MSQDMATALLYVAESLIGLVVIGVVAYVSWLWLGDGRRNDR